MGDGPGRLRGGLGILIATELNVKCIECTPFIPFAMAVILKWQQGSMIVINIYLPPGKKIREAEGIWAEVESYISELSLKYPEAQIMVAGYFNACLGPTDAQLGKKYKVTLNDPEDTFNWKFLPRIFKDQNSNHSGSCLAKFALKQRLHILNGTTHLDHPGAYTFLASPRCSTIDYMLVCPALSNLVQKFQILSYLEGDHFPLWLQITNPTSQTRHKKQWSLSTELTDKARIKVRWTTELQLKLKEILESHEIKGTLADNTNSAWNYDPIMRYDELVSIMEPILLKTTKSNTKGGSRLRYSKPWFDKECIKSKKSLIEVYKFFSKASPQTRLGYQYDLIVKKREYKILIKNKKKEHLKEQYKIMIQAAKSKNPSLFWKIITNRETTDPTPRDSMIPANTWVNFFKKMYEEALPQATHTPHLDEIPQWPRVMTSEITSYIGEMKKGKAPGWDGITPEFLKEFKEWWAPYLADLFTYIDSTGRLPKDWGMAVVVPIYKKGKRDDPSNYRPISLLSVTSKIYARHLLARLKEWLEKENIIVDEQAGFREERGTLEHCLILQHLIEKYASKNVTSLYAAFVDLKAAFDSIPRAQLWAKLENSTVDKRLLALIRMLYRNTTLRVRYSRQGHHTEQIETFNGVRQGCLLAPMLFIFYINNLVSHLDSTDCHTPKIAERSIPALLYADDIVVLARTPIGLKRAMRKLMSFCKEESLVINDSKTKVIAFGKRFRNKTWKITGGNLEQVKIFKYLGVTFQASGKNLAHYDNIANLAQKAALNIIRFHYSKGAHFVPAAIKLFQAKVVAPMLYGNLLGPSSSCFAPLERVQSKFLRAILQVPNCVSNAWIRLEMGIPRFESKIALASIQTWLKAHWTTKGLLPLILCDKFKSKWLLETEKKIRSLGFSPLELLGLKLEQSKSVIKQRIDDTERQLDLSCALKYLAPSNQRYITAPANYLSLLEIKSHRRAFTLARSSALPSAIIEGRYKKIPRANRTCPCKSGELETIEHVIFRCVFYEEARVRLIFPLLHKIEDCPENSKIRYLLWQGNEAEIMQVAKFCAFAYRVRQSEIKKKLNPLLSG